MFSALFGLIFCQHRLEPLDGKIFYGISVTNALEPIGRDPWRPNEPFVNINKRTGFNWSFFHLVQEIPEKVNPRFELLDQTATDASLYLSILPSTGWASVTNSDLEDLVKRCEEFNRRGRSVFLRFAPEFNVPWHSWGMQPNKFKMYWNRLAGMIHQNVFANKTAMVWAPFEANNYPFGDYLYFPRNGTEEFRTLDTFPDGKIDTNDDPYTPYLPNNTSTIDWVGLSIYWRSAQEPLVINVKPADDYIYRIITGSRTLNFYKAFSETLKKPMMIADTAAFYYKTKSGKVANATGASEFEIKSTWWKQLFNKTLMTNLPMLKMISFSESVVIGNEKESDFVLDSRITSDPVMLQSFKLDLGTSEKMIQWSVPANITSWAPTNITEFPGESQTSGDTNVIRNSIVFALVGSPFFIVLMWVMFVTIQRRQRGVFNENTETKNRHSVDDCSTIFGSEIDSQITTSDNGFDFDDFDHIIVSNNR